VRALAPLIYRQGWSVVPPSRGAAWPEHKFLISFLRRYAVDCVLDVGANVGQFGNELRMLGYGGRIISFEPDPGCFEELEQCARADGNWHAVNLALGDADGSATFNIMATRVFNSFLTPTTREASDYQKHNVIKEVVTVEVRRLDEIFQDLAKRFGFSRPFLKMDTQGFDIRVFNGAAGVHQSFVGLKSELSIKRLYENVPDWTDVIRLYDKAGFELSAMFSVHPEKDRLIEMDCYFKPKHALAPQSSRHVSIRRVAQPCS